MRIQDFYASQRPDLYLAISKAVQKRIAKYYRQPSKIIYPPVETEISVNKTTAGKYFLVVSRLVSYKRIDLIIKVFNDLKLPLKVIGVGNQLNSLKKFAHQNIDFLGQVTDDKLTELYENSTALVIAADEDFGITSVEAQAYGKPVIAYAEGGTGETVIDGKTGLLFHKQSEKYLKLAIYEFKRLQFKPSDCRQNAQKYSQKIFIKNFSEFVTTQWRIYQAK
jgi:glycosyltransferase involved in cell wall biosynthesis